MCAQGAVKAAQHDGDFTATSNDSDPSNNMGLEARVVAQHNVRQQLSAMLEQVKCLQMLIKTVLDNGAAQS